MSGVAECRGCGERGLRSAGVTECGGCGVWGLWSAAVALCGICGMWRLRLEVCVLGWAGVVPVWPVFMEKYAKKIKFFFKAREWVVSHRVVLSCEPLI